GTCRRRIPDESAVDSRCRTGERCGRDDAREVHLLPSQAAHRPRHESTVRHRMIGGARLILVRHGETEGESSIRYHGRTDVALSELGRTQMNLAGRAIEK